MAVLKCKMCGGDLAVGFGMTVCECEYCGSKQTVPLMDNEKKLTLFSRANRLRAACEFDKASLVYESVVAEFPEEAEAYWGIVLCRFGIEYVDDPKTGRKIPTCHRPSFDSVLEDPDFEMALGRSDVASRAVYREEATAMERLRMAILEVSSKEEPYDVFICYKETDEDGGRTMDSVLAQDIYDELTEKGYKVFFARITLEEKLGEEYEPYIFAALHSARVMLVVGTDYEHFNAVWVKNEWSRFLSLIEAGSKKTLIPCYQNLDAYDMPPEFRRLQAQDLGKVGAIQDLARGVGKIIGERSQRVNAVAQNEAGSLAGPSNSSTEPLLRRAFLFLEDQDWLKADEFLEKVLNLDPENALAYVGKLMAEFQVSSQICLGKVNGTFRHNRNYKKAIRFADERLKEELEGYNAKIEKRKREEFVSQILSEKKKWLNEALTETDFRALTDSLRQYSSYPEIMEFQKNCCKEYENRCVKAKELWLQFLSRKEEWEGWQAKEKEFDQEIRSLEKSRGIVEQVLDEILSLSHQVQRVEGEMKECAKRVSEYSGMILRQKEKRSNLGFLALSEKKEIDSIIAALQKDLQSEQEQRNQLTIFHGELRQKIASLKKEEELIREKERIGKEIDFIAEEKRRFFAEKKIQEMLSIRKEMSTPNCLAILLHTDEQDVFHAILSDEEFYSKILSVSALAVIAESNPLLQKMPSEIRDGIQKKSGRLDAETRYFQACQALGNPRNEEDILWAKAQFMKLTGYKDAEDKISECNRRIAGE